MRNSRPLFVCVGVSLLCSQVMPAVAQESGVATRGAQGVIEEVVVTARKREETQQEVPLAVTAFTGDGLVEAGVEQFSDLADFTPNLTMQQHSSFSSATVDGLTLRGQTSGGVQLSNDPAVGVLIDGVVNPHSASMQTALFDIERVEVLKGPQGTLFGRNTTGGVINIVTRRAELHEQHGYIEADAGNHSAFQLRGAFNAPLGEQAAVRLAYQRQKRDGFGESKVTGQDLGSDQDQHYIRGSLRWHPADSFRILVGGDWSQERENGNLQTTSAAFPDLLGNIEASLSPASGCAPFDAACGLAFAQMRAQQGRDDIFSTYSAEDHFDDTDSWSLNATLEWDITDVVMLKSVTGYREFEHTHLTNFTGAEFRGVLTGDPAFPERDLHQEYKLFSQELNLSGIAFADRVDWLLGAYYHKDKGADRDFVHFLPASTAAFLGSPIVFVFDAPSVDQDSWALFGQSSMDIAEAVTLTVGARYTEETKEQVSAHATVASSDPLVWACGDPPRISGVIAPAGQRVSACSLPRRKVGYDGWSWLVSIDWQATDEMMLYARAAEGWRGGGFDIRSAYANPPPAPFEPETATEYEIGMKADWFDNRLRTNVALFTTDYQNKQETIVIPGPATATVNAAEAELDGMEFEFSIVPVDGLVLRGNAAYLKGEYSSFPNSLVENAEFNPVTLTPAYDPVTNTYNAKGEDFDDPRWTYSLGGRYEIFVGGGELAFNLNWSWRDEAPPRPSQTDFELPEDLRDDVYGSVGLLNARIEYNINQFRIALWANNLLDKEYQRISSPQSNAGGIQSSITAEPRLWGATVGYRFE